MVVVVVGRLAVVAVDNVDCFRGYVRRLWYESVFVPSIKSSVVFECVQRERGP